MPESTSVCLRMIGAVEDSRSWMVFSMREKRSWGFLPPLAAAKASGSCSHIAISLATPKLVYELLSADEGSGDVYRFMNSSEKSSIGPSMVVGDLIGLLPL